VFRVIWQESASPSSRPANAFVRSSSAVDEQCAMDSCVGTRYSGAACLFKSAPTRGGSGLPIPPSTVIHGSFDPFNVSMSMSIVDLYSA